MPENLSIIVPVYNRRSTIRRCLDSVLGQAAEWPGRLEVVVVDDASQDDTVPVIRSTYGGRVHVVQHAVNQGVGPARNTGVAHSSGEWLFFLDSDDELATGALECFQRRIAEAPAGTDRIRFMVRWDDGRVSPQPPHDGSVWGYEDYLRHINAVQHMGESCSLYRRSVFDTISWARDRSAEGEFHLACFKQFKCWAVPDVVRLYHQDASVRVSGIGYGRAQHDEKANVAAAGQADRILEAHGAALARLAPRVHSRVLKAGCQAHFLCGHRWAGLRYGMRALAAGEWGRVPALIVLGLLGPTVLSRALAVGKRLRR